MLKAVTYKNIREQGSVEGEFPIPDSLIEAYKIQKSNLSDIKGWKLGGTTNFTRELFKTDSVYYGGVGGSYIFNASDAVKVPSFIKEPSGEAEVAFRLTDKVKELSTLNIKTIDMAELINTVIPSIEFPWSAFPLPGCGLEVLVADSCAAGFLVFGEEISWSKELEALIDGKVSVFTGTQLLASGSVDNIIGGPVDALRSFLSLAKEHEIEFSGGEIVATGGCTSCVPIPVGEKIFVKFEGLNSFEFNLEF
jgi:2-keto-4-pentenoate hydratase